MAVTKNYKRNQYIGGWRLEAKLGKGGNGEVWRVTDGQNFLAMKLLKRIRPNIYTRFRDEIRIISDNQDIEGIVPIHGFSIPEDISKVSPWFLMPIAEKFSDWREKKEVVDIVRELSNLARTLAHLHDRDIYHRDIKPANLLAIDNKLHLSDFGLVKYPNKEDITVKGNDIGPKFTMAPEMRRDPDNANFELADVYSFAKTLWVAVTGDLKCFDGQYNQYSTLSINPYCLGLYTKSLHELLSDCTEHAPDKRPTMAVVSERLEQWLKVNDDFHDKNLTEWFDLQNQLFPAGTPSSTSWTRLDDIVTILNKISDVRSLNHMFYPDGGGHNFIGAEKAKEDGFISIYVSKKSCETLKPKKLTFESFGLNPQWDYFRLECDIVEPTGVYEKLPKLYSAEELVEINPGEYIPRIHWDENEYMGEPLPGHAQVISRFMKGCFVIFSTRSRYNLTSSTYDGRHNKMSEAAFREYISEAADKVR
ncbi:serine/threonine protein kinase [Vibrio furnissii]|uniref:serine/threonine protein kinase n=1 Tax=Vibrio furnissii TaxID=29494 RepID=UPI0001B92F1F|nr:protein kinase [Vibrio furnissii]EEX40802.1 serine/threonine protein kinase [Vibrio furnissii CIP 102972]QDC95481.1 serine/threonine protein kinase [Vibrio furnissii]UON50911.1 protein kinase [Vibrio furnissii]SUQ33220.1 Serine/threonine-protein kinase pknE [Vibrio furnissii]